MFCNTNNKKITHSCPNNPLYEFYVFLCWYSCIPQPARPRPPADHIPQTFSHLLRSFRVFAFAADQFGIALLLYNLHNIPILQVYLRGNCVLPLDCSISHENLYGWETDDSGSEPGMNTKEKQTATTLLGPTRLPV